jgi:hypothetical protein
MPNSQLENEINRMLVDIANYARSKDTSEPDEHFFDISYNPKTQAFSVFTWLEGDGSEATRPEPTKTEGHDLYMLLSAHAKALIGEDYTVKDIEGSSQLSEVFKEVDGLARTGLGPEEEGTLYFVYYFHTGEFNIHVDLEEHNLLGIPHDDQRWHYIDCFDGMEDTLESEISGTSVIEMMSHQVKTLKELISDAQKRLAHLV